MENKYENKEICKECGGVCCKTSACHFSPSDFKEITFEYLKSRIEQKDITIDWWEGNIFEDTNSNDPRKDIYISNCYFLRKRHYEIKFDFKFLSENLKINYVLEPVVNGSWGGICKDLTPNGCIHCFEDRPKGARLLMPVGSNSDGFSECIIKYSKEECVKEWFEYNDILEELHDYFKDNPLEDTYSKMPDELIKDLNLIT